MAEFIFNNLVNTVEGLKEKFKAGSRGLMAVDGDNASDNSTRVLMDKWGISLSAHRSQKLTAGDMEKAFLVLAMTKRHKERLIALYPDACKKIHTLKEFILDNHEPGICDYDYALDIDDPYGMPVRIYSECADDIKNAVVKLIEKLKKDNIF